MLALKDRSSIRLSYPKYRRDIDGLRAVAVLSVVVFHAFPGVLRGGFTGVDVFFVISGFLISTIILESLKNGNFSFSEFYGRRVRRIFPALLIVLTGSLVFGWFALLPDEYDQLGRHVAAGAVFVSNFVLWGEVGYFDNSAETKPLLHLWSLGIEEQFYIVWPLMLWIAFGRGLSTLHLILGLAFASFLLNLHVVGTDGPAAFYAPQTRFWELLCGSLLAWFRVMHNSPSGAVGGLGHWQAAVAARCPGGQAGAANLLSLTGIALLAYGFLFISKDVGFPGGWAAIPVLGTVLLIAAGDKAWFNRKVLSGRVSVWFGLVSFPLYLWHWPLLAFARILEGNLPSPTVRLSAVCLSVVLAWITYRLVERPFRSSGNGGSKVAVLLLLMTLVGGAGYIVHLMQGNKLREGASDLGRVNAEFVGPLWKYTHNKECLTRYPLKDVEKYGWWFCMVSGPGKPSLLILGNSYANHFYPGVVSNPAFKGHVVLSIGTCDAGWVDESDLTGRESRSPCSGRRPLDQLQLINRIVQDERSIRYVLIGGVSDEPDAAYIERLRRRIDFLERAGARVILFVPHVRVPYDIKGCYARPFREPRHTCVVPASVHKERLARFSKLAYSIRKAHPSVLVFDQNQVFCDEKTCSFKLEGMPAFRDEYAHLSEFGSGYVMSAFASWAKVNAPDLLAAQP